MGSGATTDSVSPCLHTSTHWSADRTAVTRLKLMECARTVVTLPGGKGSEAASMHIGQACCTTVPACKALTTCSGLGDCTCMRVCMHVQSAHLQCSEPALRQQRPCAGRRAHARIRNLLKMCASGLRRPCLAHLVRAPLAALYATCTTRSSVYRCCVSPALATTACRGHPGPSEAAIRQAASHGDPFRLVCGPSTQARTLRGVQVQLMDP